MATATAKNKTQTKSELLLEFVANSTPLKVDAVKGIIYGVKILGLESRNGRSYAPEAVRNAASLYEGAKANVNHPKGSATQPRDLQDRLGSFRSVEYRESQGLFGNLHYNPKHAIAESLAWAAEHSPSDIGFSHNAEARVRRGAGGKQIVEAITSVVSVDLVADPATTKGLFEHIEEPNMATEFTSALVTLEHLSERGDLREAIIREHLQSEAVKRDASELASLREQKKSFDDSASELKRLREENDRYKAEAAATKQRETIAAILKEHQLDPADEVKVSEVFMKTLTEAESEEEIKALVSDRAGIFAAARTKPRSRSQVVTESHGFGHVDSVDSFVSALRN